MAPGPDDVDRTLGARARLGDRDALAALYERHRSRLLGFLRRMAGAGAEDLFQETWMKVIGTVHQYEPDRGPFRAWLYRIASNIAIDRLRVEARDRSVDDDVLDEMTAAGSDPEGRLASLETERHLQRLLAGIEPRQRHAIVLRHQLGFTYAEIAAILGVTENTAKTFVHRGLIALRRRMEGPS